MKEYDIYFVDFDGTILDSAESVIHTFLYAFAQLGELCTREQALSYMHISLDQTMDLRKIPQERRAYFLEQVLIGLDLDESLQKVKIFPETEEFLRRLKAQGKIIGVVSNNTSTHIRLILKRYGIEEYFSVVSGSDLFENGKPFPDPIDTALRMIGRESKEGVVYIGDSLQDPECAANAKVDGILIDRKDEYPDFEGTRISSLLEVIPLLRK